MESLTCFSSRSRGTCCAVILERLAENCRGRTTAIICTRTNAPKYILESHRLHFGSICDQNGRNFEPWFYRTTRTHCTNTSAITGHHTKSTSTTLHMNNLLHLCTTICCSTNLLLIYNLLHLHIITMYRLHNV